MTLNQHEEGFEMPTYWVDMNGVPRDEKTGQRVAPQIVQEVIGRLPVPGTFLHTGADAQDNARAMLDELHKQQ
jgi:hypothetical protein